MSLIKTEILNDEQIISEIAFLKKRISELKKIEAYEIIEHQQTLKALQQSEDKFYKAFHSCPDAMTMSTFSDGIFIEVNEAFASLFGYDANEMRGRAAETLAIWYPPEERGRIIKKIRDNGSIRNIEMTLQTKRKEILTTLISADQINIAGENYLLFVVKDISKRKRIEETLRLSEECFYKAFNASPITMTMTTVEEGKFLKVNNSFCRMFGFDRKSILGKTAYDIGFWVNPSEREEVKQSILNNISVTDKEVQFRRSSGDIRLGSYSAERVDINGKICMLSLFHDLTERKLLEIEMRRLDRLNLVGEMSASIGHEIRNPITTVRGYLQLLRENPDYISDLECFDLMIEELDSANEIISEFLSLAKNKTLELKPSNLNTIIKSIFPLLQANATLQDKSIALELEAVPDLLLDEKEIRLLIINLVNNGLDAVSSGQTVKLGTCIDGHHIILYIQDQGKGIPQDIILKLGTPFFTTKDNHPGLGLAVCYGIAAQHKAKIDIQTGVDGTTFLVRFINS